MAHIEKRRNGLYAVVEVPPTLREVVGRKRLRKTLGTTEMATAKMRFWSVVAELMSQIAAARSAALGTATEDEARKLREAMRKAAHDEAEALRDHIVDRAYQIRGKPIGETIGVDPADYEYDPERERRAEAFFDLARGKATPLEEYLEQWLSEAAYTDRTKGDHRRAVQRLRDWPDGHITTLEAVTQKKAGAFVSWLLHPQGEEWTGDRKTAAKYKSSLSSYWAYLKGKGFVDGNPWAEQTIPKPKAHLEGVEKAERPFTDDELRLLLSGPADPLTADLLCMGALSGMRIEELCRLTVGMVQGGLFQVTKAKTLAGIRRVPIHPDLEPIVERRTRGKSADAYLFSELTDPLKGSTRERSMPAVKRFSRYIRAMGVAVVIEGKRRSLVNFHSLRRWFITKAEQAGQPEPIIKAVVGHKRPGMTLGLYSAGPSLEQYRACVEAVRLPVSADAEPNRKPKAKGGDDHGL